MSILESFIGMLFLLSNILRKIQIEQDISPEQQARLVSTVKFYLAIYRLVEDLYLRQLWFSIGSNQRPQRSRPIGLVVEAGGRNAHLNFIQIIFRTISYFFDY